MMAAACNAINGGGRCNIILGCVCMFMRVRVYVCMHVCMHIYIYIYIYIFLCSD